jgi:hypothetical protein
MTHTCLALISAEQGKTWLQILKTRVLFHRGIQLKYLNTCLTLVSFACIFIVLKSSDEPLLINDYHWLFEKFNTGNSILFNISTGMLVSIWFYFLVIVLPSNIKKNRVKKHFIIQYQEFRKQLIIHILKNSKEPFMQGLAVELKDVTKFKTYFHTQVMPNQNRWFIFTSTVSEEAINDMLAEFEAFKEAITVLLINVEIQDEAVFYFLHQVRKFAITQRHMRTDDYFSLKAYFNFLWQMLAGFDKTDGYKEYDNFAIMFEKI